MTTSLNLFFQKAEKIHSKSQKQKEKQKASENQTFSKWFCVQDKYSFDKSAKESSATNSAVSTRKQNLCGFFIFPWEWCSPHVRGWFGNPSLFFQPTGSETFAQSTRTMKSFEKLEKNTFFQKNCSGHYKICLDNRDELFLA